MEEDINSVFNEQDSYGLTTGFTDLDDLMHGLYDGEMIVVGSGPGMGKTSFVLNVMHHVAVKKRIPVTYFSLVHSAEQLYSRLLSIDSMVELDHIKTGEIDDKEKLKIDISKKNLEQAPIHIIDDVNYHKVSDIERKCIELKREENMSLVILDYFQLFDTDSDNVTNLSLEKQRQQKMCEVSKKIKELTVKLNIPVMVLTTLCYRRLDMRKDHIPKMNDLNRLGNLENDADVVLFIHRDECYDAESDKRGRADIIIAKHRKGNVGSIELAWIEKFTKYANLNLARKW